ncbi:MAG: hypothetical protein K9J16_17780 [Melioribacteraceae bacterium]|nr:hypothetical protein [Melioribacteraceae bacterium]MCF8356735.1 hypothetical protein [Melioribacteraceae bacterium]MCF8396089.1 hypothetical protein [Melioribacteraceae bacterium]MCF8421075.1 hypothetical protein [Melioribacteraceae bacterium]
MADQEFSSYLSYGVSYQKENIFGVSLLLNYSYHQIKKENVFNLVYIRDHGDPPPNIFIGDISHISHNIDLDYIDNFSNYFSFGIGVSLVINNRILNVEKFVEGKQSRVLNDKLASSGIGANGNLKFFLPLNKGEKYFYLTSLLKLRYTHSIWFDEDIRELDNYKQEYITSNLSIGIGYSF